uniref:F-box domain-containing protein n=1 Tax=Globodera pallida TaxID=36090 RepID=A0A183BR17_GLOPA
MSEHPREAQRHLKKINVCDDVCYCVFGFIGRATLGLKVALISARFDALVDKHFKHRHWTIDRIEIRRRPEDGTDLKIFKRDCSYSKFDTFPIATSPLPDNIIGFRCLAISCMDDNVIAFLHRFQRLFSKDLRLWLSIDSAYNRSWALVMRKLWPLVVKNVAELRLDGLTLADVQQHITPAIVRDCANVQLIKSTHIFPEAPGGDASPVGQALFEWLHTPLKNDLPKVFGYGGKFGDYYETVNRNVEELKKAFINASTPVSYIVNFESRLYGGEPFEFENKRTRERLKFEHLKCDFSLLKRCPIEWDKSRWDPWNFHSLCLAGGKMDSIVVWFKDAEDDE